MKRTRPAHFTEYLIRARSEARRRLTVASARIDEHARKAKWFAHAQEAYGEHAALREALWHRQQLAAAWAKLAAASRRLATIERSLAVV